MKPLKFLSAQFIASYFKFNDMPQNNTFKEIAIAGKSNVGKSSLINHLLTSKKLAKVSSSPGKTRSFNLFLIDKTLNLLDLPGYGYAKVEKKQIKMWAKEIDEYFHLRQNLNLVLLLIDIRHSLSDNDKSFLQWLHYYKKSVLIVFTKTDKLNKQQLQKNTQNNVEQIKSFTGITDPVYIHYSIKSATSRKTLIKAINDTIVKEE
jgi:GTP-binding protein